MEVVLRATLSCLLPLQLDSITFLSVLG